MVTFSDPVSTIWPEEARREPLAIRRRAKRRRSRRIHQVESEDCEDDRLPTGTGFRTGLPTCPFFDPATTRFRDPFGLRYALKLGHFFRALAGHVGDLSSA